MNIDWKNIIENLLVATIGGGIGWVFTKIGKLCKDMNIAFTRIRKLEENHAIDHSENSGNNRNSADI